MCIAGWEHIGSAWICSGFPASLCATSSLRTGRNLRFECLPHFQTLHEVTRMPSDSVVLYFGRLSEEKGLGDLLRGRVWFPRSGWRLRGMVRSAASCSGWQLL